MNTTYFLDFRSATAHFPGIGRYVHNLARQLPSLLHDDEQLVFLTQPTQENREVIKSGDKRIEQLAVAASPFSFQQQWQVPTQLRRFDNSQSVNGGQGKHATQPGSQSHAKRLYHSPYYLMPYRPGMPTVLTFYDAMPIHFPQYVSFQARLLFRITTQLALRTATHVMAISQSAANDLHHFFAYPRKKITVIPLGVEQRFAPQPDSELQRLRLQYNLPAQFLLYLGINKPHKNLLALIEAYAQVLAQGNEAAQAAAVTPLVIAGAWDNRYPESKERVVALGLEQKVRFIGRIAESDQPALYSAASAFIFPSRYEGFGLPVLEAMACGTPVACSNVSSLPEVAGQAALLFDPTALDAIASAIGDLLTKQELRQRLREGGIKQAANFQWQSTAELTLATYRQTLRNLNL